MRLEALQYVACPACKSELRVDSQSEQDGGHIITGMLSCPACSTSYPIIRGVPRLLQTDGHDVDLDTGTAYADYFDEILAHAPQDEARLYGLTLEEEMTDFLAKSHVASLNDLNSKVFLDAGCGVGRIDGLLAQHCKAVVALDITPAVERAFHLWRDMPNVHIVQGNMVTLPVQTQQFDFVWCDGALPYVSDFDRSLGELLRARHMNSSLYAWCYDQKVSLKERIGRFFHRTQMPLKIRFTMMRLVALLLMMGGSVIRRKNMLPLAHTYAQGILDWSLAGQVNHVSESQIRSAASNLEADVYVTNRRHHVELYINLPPE